MPKLLIHRNSMNHTVPNFEDNEFFCKCPDFLPNCHYLDLELIFSAQLIREWISSPVFVTSSFRTPACNARCGGMPDSFHLSGHALDLACPGYQGLVNTAIINRSTLYQNLRKSGINGFGLAHGFIHIDTRPSGARLDENFGSYDLWSY